MFFASMLFLLALFITAHAVLISLSGNMTRIHEVLEQRSGVSLPHRRITIGALRSPTTQSAYNSPTILRRVIISDRKLASTLIPQQTWQIAA